MQQRYTIDISTATLLRVLVISAAVVSAILLWKILAGLLLAIIIASALEPLIRWFKRHRVHRGVTVIVIYTAAILFLGGVFYLIFPNIFFELRDLSSDFPGRYEDLTHTLGNYFGFPLLPEFQGGELNQFFASIRSQFGLVTSDIFAFAFTVFGGILTSLLVFIISFYLSLQERGIEKFLASVTPSVHHEYILDLWRRAQRKMSLWVGAQFILVLFIAVTLFPILWALGAKYALTLAIMAALLEVIPVIGPIAAGFILFFFTLLQSPTLALMVLIAYVALEQVQQQFVVPVVVSRALGLNPVIIVLLLFAGGSIAGFWGAILAIPLGAVLVEFLRDVKQR